MTINAHLRNEHGYSLAESIRQAPHVMAEIHEMEHQERAWGHSHTDETDVR